MPRRELATRITRRGALAAGAAALASACGVRAQAAREPAWIDQRRLGPFVCRATFPLGDRLVAEADLPRLEQELRRVLALRPCGEEVEILLFANAAEHKRFIARRHPEAPYRRALFYKQRGRGVIYAYRHKELPTDLRHEGTHALLHADLPMVPLWLDEGLAEYFEPPARQCASGPDHLRRLVRDMKAGKVCSLSALERKHDLAELSESDYRYAWAWTHFLLHGPREATEQLWSFLAALRRWEPPGLMSERLAVATPGVEQRFVAHFRRWPDVLRAASASGVRV